MEKPEPVQVVYCAVCTFPVEFCEFSDNFTSCKKWLAVHHPEAYPELSEEFERIRNGEEPVEEEKKAVPGKKVKFVSKKQVVVSILKRGKTKNITKIDGLKDFGVNLKEASKSFRKHFASGCAVVDDGIEIQGDLVDDVIEKILEDFKEITEADIMISDSNKTKKCNKGKK
jgi:density-regulated protein DRP1